MTRTPRVALIGNIAQNAYLGAKFLRRMGVQADSFDTGGGNAMWLPWWEESDLDPTQLYPSHYDWVSVAEATGIRRPPWAKIMGVHGLPSWYDTQEEYQADLPHFISSATHGPLGESQGEQDAIAREALAESRLSEEEQAACVRGLRDVSCWRSIREIARHYDLLVLYGPFAGSGVIVPRDVPYITFEHSTMRMVPLLDKPDRVLLACSYKYADHNIITNADCREAAWALNLDPDRLSFIPHPLDTDLFSPAPAEGDSESEDVKARLREGVPGGAELLVFAPARQSNSAETGAKRNDRFFHAFARYVSEAEPAGAPRAALIAGQWGNPPDVLQSRALSQSLGLAERVVWLNSQPKRRMRSLYRAADIVLDQFDGACGSFGTVTAEALSTGRPVITHISAKTHEWCADRLSMPPVAHALTSPEIYDQLVRLATLPNLRAALGTESRAWVLREHSWQRVTQDHLDLYAKVLDVPVAALTEQEEQAPAPLTIGALALSVAGGSPR